MKVIKIQTYKNSLIFSFKEQKKIDTDLTIITTKINLEELVFSFKYILKNKKLMIKFLSGIINTKNINKITITEYELFDIALELIKNLPKITSFELRDKTILNYDDCEKIIKIKNIKKFKCYSLPLYMLEKLDKSNLDVTLYSEEFYLSNFMLDNKFNNYADIYYAKVLIIKQKMNKQDLIDFKAFLRINKYLNTIYLYYYKKELVQDIITMLDEVNIKKIKFKIYQQDKDNHALEELANYINKNKIKKLSYSFKIIYSKEYINKNFMKQLSFTNLKMCAFIMIITLISGIGFKIYYDYEANKNVEDIYNMVDLINDNEEPNEENLDVNMDASEEQKKDEGAQKKVIQALTEDFNQLRAINSDTVGWIKVQSTNINYPVVQTTDNDFYLHYNFYKKKNYNGWVFMDYRNSIENLNQNTIIYGHNGTMFGQLKNALKESWYTKKSNQIITFNTLYAKLQYQIFAIYITTPDFDYLVNNYIYSQNYEKFLNEVKSRSIYNFGVDVTTEDKILTLSTCAEAGAKRIVIHAKLI